MVSEVVEEGGVRLSFPDPEDLSPPILQLNDVGFGYSSQKQIFRDLNLGVDLASRVALVGANGSGKTTLLKLLSGEFQPTSGQLLKNSKLRFSAFSQHFVEQLDLTQSPLEYFHSLYPTVSTQEIRSHLGRYGLSGDLAVRIIKTLSGGQKSRVVFAQMAWKKPHLLLLDEPSNHLDIEAIEGLARSLGTFTGGVLLISHDERLIRLVCDEIWYLKDGTVTVFEGDFDEYKKMLLKNNSLLAAK